jgi:hypothetical protein
MHLHLARQSYVRNGKEFERGHFPLGVCWRAAKETGRNAAQKCQAKGVVGGGEGCVGGEGGW